MSLGFSTEIAVRELAEGLASFLNGKTELVKDADLDGNTTWRFQRHLED